MSHDYVICRDLTVDEAIELGQRSIYHATFRDAASGGTVSGECCSGQAGRNEGGALGGGRAVAISGV